ncbi:MAG: AlpA family transcriptional regulator [Rhodoferax sp.]|nr:AlpA family transcriptional regulator [Rhodoferax sp.]
MASTENTSISLMRLAQVSAKTGIARSTIYKLMAEGKFPKSVKVTAKSVAFPSNQIDQWIASRIAGATA